MAEEDIHDRVRSLEKNHSKMEIMIEHLTETLDEIRDSIRAFLDLRGKVDNYGGQLNQLWPRIDGFRADLATLDKKVDSVKMLQEQYAAERPRKMERIDKLERNCDSVKEAHANCQKQRDEERAWTRQRTGSLIDKIVPWLMIVAALAMVGKSWWVK